MTRGNDVGASTIGEAESRMRAAYAGLPALLEHHDAHDPLVLEARLALAEACADAGHLEDAVQQLDELVKDCLRARGEGDALSVRARELEGRVWERARVVLGGGSEVDRG